MPDDAPVLSWGRLDALPPREAYALLQLRIDVFVVEQACPYRELDGRDFGAHHLLCLIDGVLAGALRLLPVEGEAPARIGRVVVAPAFRGRGLGRVLMDEALAESRRRGCRTLQLAAQAHLAAFYAGFGFRPLGDTYAEDGIPHVDMRLTLKDDA